MSVHAHTNMHMRTRKAREKISKDRTVHFSDAFRIQTHNRLKRTLFIIRAQELCENQDGCPRLPTLISLQFLSAYLFIMTKHFVTIIAFFHVFESCFRTLAVLVSAAFRLGGLARETCEI